MDAATFASRAASTKRRPGGQGGGDGGNHRIAGAGDVEHLARLSGQVSRFAGRPHQGHALLAASDENGLDAAGLYQLARRGGDGRRVVGRQTARLRQFLAVGRDHRGATIARPVGALGVNHHRHATRARKFDQSRRYRLGQHALAIIRQHQRAGPGHLVGGRSGQPLQCQVGDWGQRLVIGAQKLLVARDKAGLDGGLAPRIDTQHGIDPAQHVNKVRHLATGSVVPHTGEETRPRAKTNQIAHHVARAAQHGVLAPHPQHGNGSFRRNAVNGAVNEPIQHHIAGTQYAGGGQGGGKCGEGGLFGHLDGCFPKWPASPGKRGRRMNCKARCQQTVRK